MTLAGAKPLNQTELLTYSPKLDPVHFTYMAIPRTTYLLHMQAHITVMLLVPVCTLFVTSTLRTLFVTVYVRHELNPSQQRLTSSRTLRFCDSRFFLGCITELALQSGLGKVHSECRLGQHPCWSELVRLVNSRVMQVASGYSYGELYKYGYG